MQHSAADDRLYLTFDDGPDPQWTPRILDLLAAAQMNATFFAIGRQAQRAPELARRIAAEGHAIGNHTFSHRHPWLMSPRSARAQVRDGSAALKDVIGDAPRLFRPPHGRSRACMIEEAQRQGEQVAMWDVSAVDWGPLGTAERIRQRLERIGPNDIVLMHDGRNRHNRPDQLVRILPGLLHELRQRGLRSVAMARSPVV